MTHRRYAARFLMLLCASLLLLISATTSRAQEMDATLHGRAVRVEPGLRRAIETAGSGQYFVYLDAQADLSAAYDIEDWTARGQYVHDTLWQTAQTSQANLTNFLHSRLAARQVTTIRSFYIVNAILVESNVETFDLLAARGDVARLEAVQMTALPELMLEHAETAAPEAVEWGIAAIRADQVWNDFGVDGSGIVIAGIDTGVDHDHAALINQYRGTSSGSHDYNWFDPNGASTPFDNVNHGTHTMGTMVGDDGSGNQIGVAPGASWIAAKGCATNHCSDSDLLAAAEWVLAPYPVGSTTANADPAQRPHIVNNSWDGGRGNSWFQAAADAWRAAGIVPIFSAGNYGPTPNSHRSPGDYCNVISNGMVDSGDVVDNLSSRGPGSFTNCSNKPDLTAPGVAVRSAIDGGLYAESTGTSMAAPHTAGCVALLLDEESSLTYEDIYTLMTSTAIDLGPAGYDPDYGIGRLDCYAALDALQPDFRMPANLMPVDVCIPSSGSTSVAVGSIMGFASNVTLSTSGTPTGMSTSFVPPSVVPAGSSTLNIGSASVTTGTYTFDVVGTSGALVHTTPLTVNVHDLPPTNASHVTPPDGSQGVVVNPTLTWNPVTSASSYNIDVATDPAFSTIIDSATGIVGTNYQLVATLANDTHYFWRVTAVNGCGGTASAVWGFATEVVSQMCSTPNLVLDAGTSTVVDDIVMTTSGSLTDMNVFVDAAHTWVGDLSFMLTHVDTGTSVTFIDRPGWPDLAFGCNQNDIEATLDDEASTAVEGVCTSLIPTINGAFTPNNSLSAFDGEDVSGTWRLTVNDAFAAQDHGQLNEWCVLPSVPPMATADYSDLTAGYGVAWHAGSGTLRLGFNWTADTSFEWGQDDVDDDGVLVEFLEPGVASVMGVGVSGTPAGSNGWLRIWFDWNDDGDFDDSGEQVHDAAVTVGVHAIPLAPPVDMTASSVAYRVRLFDQATAPLAPAQLNVIGAASGGEVEDGMTPEQDPTGISLLGIEIEGSNQGAMLAGTLGVVAFMLLLWLRRRRLALVLNQR